MTPVTITYQLGEDSFMAGCDQLWAHRAIGRRGNYILAGLLLACGVFLLWQGVPGYWGVGLLIGAGVFVALDQARDRIWRRYFRAAPKYRGPITSTFVDTGVYVQSQEGENSVSWSTFRDYCYTADYLFLIIDQRQFSVIPRTALTTPSDAAAVEDLLKAHLKPLKARLL